MSMVRCLLATVLGLGLLSVAEGQVVKLDFGSTKSPLRKGFTRVTPDTKFGQGVVAGWISKRDLRAGDVPMVWQDKSLPPEYFATDTRCDHVTGRRAATLGVNVPNGVYRVWVFCAAGAGRERVWDIMVNSSMGTWRSTMGGSYSQRFGELDARAANGRLELSLSSRSQWVLSAAVLAPRAQWPSVRKGLVDMLEREVTFMPDAFAKMWKRPERVSPNPMPEFTAAEKKRGFVIHATPWVRNIWPNDAPLRSRIGAPIRAFASCDEYEPITFTIFPLRAFKDVRVEVDELTCRRGGRIFRDAIDVRYVRYAYVRPRYSRSTTCYRAPETLMPMKPCPLIKGENFRVWITLKTAASQREGFYKGRARVISGDKVLATAPLLLRVLPIKLQKDRGLVYGMYYHHPYQTMWSTRDPFEQAWWRRKAELEHADMAAHGMNTITTYLGGRRRQDGTWTLAFDRLGEVIDLCRSSGMYQPIVTGFPAGRMYSHYMKRRGGSHLVSIKMPPKAFFDELTRMVARIEAERRRRQWPELLYYPVDEPGVSDNSVRYMTAVMKAIKRVPGVRTYVTANPATPAYAPMKPYVDVWCGQPFSMTPEQIAAGLKRGVEYWCYPNHINGENDHTPVAGARMTYGFGLWRSGYCALIPWIYQAVRSDPWNYLDSAGMDFFIRTADDAGPVPVTLWEAYREGIDDYRYVTTLTRFIARARKAGLTRAADEAEKDLKLIRDAIKVQQKYKYDGLWAPEMFNVYRWMLADQIMKIKAAL